MFIVNPSEVQPNDCCPTIKKCTTRTKKYCGVIVQVINEGEEVEYCSDIPKGGVLGFLGFKENKCFKSELEPVELDQILIGGNEFKWNYEVDAVEMIIYITYDSIPKTVTDMADVYKNIFDENRVRYPELI